MQSINSAGEFGNAGKGPIAEGQEVDLFSSHQKILEMEQIVFTTKINVVKGGITKGDIGKIKDLLELDYATLGYMLSVTDRTLYLKKGREKFSETISDKFLAIVELYSYGYKVFGPMKFHRWMKKPNRSLGGIAPIMLMNTHIGLEEVRYEIYRIEYDIF